jgi:hypothetical protein
VAKISLDRLYVIVRRQDGVNTIAQKGCKQIDYSGVRCAIAGNPANGVPPVSRLLLKGGLKRNVIKNLTHFPSKLHSYCCDLASDDPPVDVLVGGPAADTIIAGDKASISAGFGNDTIYAWGGHRDVLIDCGPDNDIAHVDSVDGGRYPVWRACESVISINPRS